LLISFNCSTWSTMKEITIQGIAHPIPLDERSERAGSSIVNSAQRSQRSVWLRNETLLTSQYINVNLKRRLKSSYGTLGNKQKTKTKYLSRTGILRSWNVGIYLPSENVSNCETNNHSKPSSLVKYKLIYIDKKSSLTREYLRRMIQQTLHQSFAYIRKRSHLLYESTA